MTTDIDEQAIAAAESTGRLPDLCRHYVRLRNEAVNALLRHLERDPAPSDGVEGLRRTIAVLNARIVGLNDELHALNRKKAIV